MRVTLRLAQLFADTLGTDEVHVILDQSEATLGDLLQALLDEQPALRERLEVNRMLENGSIKAMFVRQDALITVQDAVQDGDTIRVMLPISGGGYLL
jgi:molybdopterin converting factor small subunit